ncbi:N-6 DNA methylase [bacterium]|nr:N-6 DNA methylase [bacterium]
MATNLTNIENNLWSAADELRANSKLTAQEYSTPVLGLIFLRFADFKFTYAEEEIKKQSGDLWGVSEIDFQAKGILFLPEKARFSYLLNLPEGENIGKAINEAMKAIESKNPNLSGILPTTYNKFENATLIELIKIMASIPMDIEGDVFGKIYEYFLGKFAMAEGKKGGQFFTPTSLVKLIVNIIEPFHGRIFDPACGSVGMFVQSARFVKEHHKTPSSEISINGQENKGETVKLCKMNLAVHGLEGDIREGNTYYEDLQNCKNKFDFVMANPPFNVSKVDKNRLKDDPRFPLGMPSTDNANYLWIQIFYSALNSTGRTGFVMANSASDARYSELEIRKKLIERRVVDVMVAISSNFFYTVTLPCTLWFLDKGKQNTDSKDKVLFIDARNVFTQIDRAHREFSPEQLEFISNIARLYREEEPEERLGSSELMKEHFPDGVYRDVKGLCKVATVEGIEAQGWSLNPGRYVGVAEADDDGVDFYERLQELNGELEELNEEAHELEKKIRENVNKVLEQL